jgi:hypothetical protein
MSEQSMRERIARAIEPETFLLPHIRLYQADYDRAYAKADAVLAELEPMIAAARAEALEEAARACERRAADTGSRDAYAALDVMSYRSACDGCAFDIRALKDKQVP